jgi:hypothetical protein
MTAPTNILSGIRRVLPRGRTLPEEVWGRRHRALVLILWAHVIGLPPFALSQGLTVRASLTGVVPIVLAAVAGSLAELGRRWRSVAVVFGLLTSSAILVNAWGGQIEGHFHFFVMIAVLALYEDWVPFGLAVAYVVLQHGVLGAASPESVYAHGGDPWTWAAIHGAFVLSAVAASLTTWRLNEDMRDRVDEAHRRANETARRFQLAFHSGGREPSPRAPRGCHRGLRDREALPAPRRS